ncbi:MAG: hypothetical protein JNL67_09025 [Planctomycetaceae bacterium]|nr:hypothetical protein [Planctomycetaceae bacterium]
MSLQELKLHPAIHWSSPLQMEQAVQSAPAIVTKGFHPTRWGWFPWAPERWEETVHPDDLTIAGYLIPSPRILAVNRVSDHEEYSTYNYGRLTFRMKPSLWREAPSPGFHLGQLVEISKLHSTHEPAIVTIEEMYWEPVREKILFIVSNRGQLWPDSLEAHEFIHSNDSSFFG